MNESLSSLMHRIAERDEEAFGLLHDRMKNDMLAVAFSILRDFHAAQDVRQTAFLKVWNHACDFRGASRGDASIRAWILKLTRNTAVDYCRKNGRVLPCGELASRFDSIGDQALERIDSNMSLVDRLGLLPSDVAAVVILRSIGEFSLADCARMLQISIPTVYRRNLEGLRLLKESWRPELGDSFSDPDENTRSEKVDDDAIEMA